MPRYAGCYHVLFSDLRTSQLNSQRDNLSCADRDIYRIHPGMRETQRPTFQEFTPNNGAGNWLSNRTVNLKTRNLERAEG